LDDRPAREIEDLRERAERAEHERDQRADLVLLDGNRLVNIANVPRIRAVIVAGRLLDRTALDGVLAELKKAQQ